MYLAKMREAAELKRENAELKRTAERLEAVNTAIRTEKARVDADGQFWHDRLALFTADFHSKKIVNPLTIVPGEKLSLGPSYR